MAPPAAAVVGASGPVGRAVVKHLAAAAERFNGIKALSRTPAKTELPVGVTGVEASMSSAVELEKALAGVDTVSIVAPQGSPELRRDLTVASAKAAKAAGVGHVALLSVDQAVDGTTVFGRQFKEIEDAVTGLGFQHGVTVVRFPMFLDNIWGAKDSIKSMSKIFEPQDPTVKARYITVDDVGAALAGAMADPHKHGGRVYNPSAPLHTKTDLAAAFSDALGRPVEFVRIPDSDCIAFLTGTLGMPEWQANGVINIYNGINAGLKHMVRDGVDDFRSLTGRDPSTAVEFVKAIAPNGF